MGKEITVGFKLFQKNLSEEKLGLGKVISFLNLCISFLLGWLLLTLFSEGAEIIATLLIMIVLVISGINCLMKISFYINNHTPFQLIVSIGELLYILILGIVFFTSGFENFNLALAFYFLLRAGIYLRIIRVSDSNEKLLKLLKALINALIFIVVFEENPQSILGIVALTLLIVVNLYEFIILIKQRKISS